MSQTAALDPVSLENVSRTKLLTMHKFKGREGFFLKTFFANTVMTLNKWGVETQEALARGIKSALDTSRFPRDKFGKAQTAPTIMRADFAHPPDDSPDIIREQEPDRVGDFIDVGIDPDTLNAFTVSEITNPAAIEMLENNEIQFTSPSFEVLRGYTDTKGNFVVSEFKVNHNALVKKPAFGTYHAQIRGRCTGDKETCLHQLSSVQATTCVKMKGENVCVDTSNEEMEITEGDVNFRACEKTGNTIIEIAAGTPLNDCVQRILSNKLDKGEKPTDQDLAIAFSECRAKKGIAESLKTKQSNRESMTKGQNDKDKDPEEMTDVEKKEAILALRATIKKGQEEKKIDEEKIVDKEEAKHRKAQEDLEEKTKKNDEEIQALKATVNSEVKTPLVARIIEAKIKIGRAKKADEHDLEEDLMKKDIEALKDMSADYDALDAKLSQNSEQAVRYTMQAAESDAKPGASLLAEIRGRQGH